MKALCDKAEQMVRNGTVLLVNSLTATSRKAGLPGEAAHENDVVPVCSRSHGRR